MSNNNSNPIQLFEHDSWKLRTATIDGEPWFVARDVTDALGLDRTATRRLDDDEKGVHSTHTPGGDQQLSMVNESGLYNLVLASRKPEAKAFKRWITHEVIPAIRRTGGYMVAKDETPEETMARAVLIANDTIKRQKEKIAEMQPKALFADAVTCSEHSILVGELAKIMRQNGFEVGQNRLFEILRRDGYLMASKGARWNVPSQRSMELGLFELKQTPITHSDGHVTVRTTVKVTGRGPVYFVNKYCKQAVMDRMAVGGDSNEER